jgi:undecaprenyl-diphosphatase
MPILESVLLGLIQGLTEWLPIGSKTMTMLVMMSLLNLDPRTAYSIAILLHASSVVAPLLLFRREFVSVIARLPALARGLRQPSDETDHLLRCLVAITIASAAVAVPLYFLSRALLVVSGHLVMLLIGVILIAVGVFQLLPRRVLAFKRVQDLSALDLIVVGLVQGLSILPGLSRSGLSVTALLLCKLDKEAALRLSFMVSVPLIVGAVAVDLVEGGGVSLVQSVGVTDVVVMMALTFVASILSMGALLRVARRVNFSLFLMILGSLILGTSLVKMLMGL